MMSVKEYANDVNLSEQKVLELCKKLAINVTTEEDLLDDDAIIMLDNEIANIEVSDTEEDLVEELDNPEDEEVEETYNNQEQKSSKKKKNNKQTTGKKNDFMKKRKEMYKHKDKLKSNTVELD